jgi:hypothetical protein
MVFDTPILRQPIHLQAKTLHDIRSPPTFVTRSIRVYPYPFNLCRSQPIWPTLASFRDAQWNDRLTSLGDP